MLVKIETEIFGEFIIKDELEIFLHPYTIRVRYDSILKKHFISITKRQTDYLNHIPKVEIDTNKFSKIEFPDIVFLDDQINILRHIESFGALDIGVSSINWQNCSIEWINESNEDVTVPIRKYYRTLNYTSGKPKQLTKEWLWNTVVHRNQLKELTLPFSFFREGHNSFISFQFQNSFLHSYLMLEGFFGNSQFKNEKIKIEFSNSEILNFAIETTLQNLITDNNKHLEWTTTTLKMLNKNWDTEGIIHLLVEYRGKLSHFSIKKIGMKNTFNDKEYESLAFLALRICQYSSIKLRLEPFRTNPTH